MKRARFTPRAVVLFVALILSVPPPAFALRTSQPEHESQRTGLEEALKDHGKALRRLAQLITTPVPAPIPAAPETSQTGLEEPEGTEGTTPPEDLTPQQKEVWRYLTSSSETQVTLTEIDPDTKAKEEFTLPGLGLNEKSVRSSVALLGRHPRTLHSHWNYLTGHWPRLGLILRRTPTYLTQGFWSRHVLRANYLAVLSHRWSQATRNNVPLPRFIDLTRVHTPLITSAAGFAKLLPRLGDVVQTDDWPMFQAAWPLLAAIHQRIEAGAAWDQDWPTHLLAETELPQRIRWLLTDPVHAHLQQALFTASGRLRDPSHQISWLLPTAGLEERMPGWLKPVFGADGMEVVTGVHDMARVADKVAVLLQPELLGVAEGDNDAEVALMSNGREPARRLWVERADVAAAWASHPAERGDV